MSEIPLYRSTLRNAGCRCWHKPRQLCTTARGLLNPTPLSLTPLNCLVFFITLGAFEWLISEPVADEEG